MSLVLSAELLSRIQRHGEEAYPDEGAGFMLGLWGARRVVVDIVTARNIGIAGARSNRYLIGPDEYAQAELEAETRQLDVLGVFHSHPDHLDEPSAFDREWAQPNFAYLITSVHAGRASASRGWQLLEDRSAFKEETVEVTA